MPFGATRVFDLLDEKVRLEAELAQVKGRLSQANQALAEACQPAIDSAFKREGKPAGTIKFVADNHTYKAVVDKRVEWNSDALKEIACKLSPVEASLLFKTTYSVPEAAYKAVINPELRAKLTVARLVKYSEPKISLDD